MAVAGAVLLVVVCVAARSVRMRWHAALIVIAQSSASSSVAHLITIWEDGDVGRWGGGGQVGQGWLSLPLTLTLTLTH